jgi:hypothetical protein
MLRGWSRTLERNRFCIQVFVVTPLAMVCASYGNFVSMLVLFLVGFWPFPYRARWSAEGLHVSWLLVRECLPLADIESARLRTNFRYLLFRHELVLEIALGGGRRALLLAAPDTLEMFHAEITTALGLRAGFTSSDLTLVP